MSVSVKAQSTPSASPFRRHGISLRLRLSLIVLTAALVVFAAVAVAVLLQARDALTQTAKDKLELNTNALRDNVQTWLDLNVKALQALASQPAIVSMDPQQQKPYLEAMQQAFASQQAFKEQVSQNQNRPLAMYLVSTTDLNGLNVARSDQEAAKDYKSREWFQGARNGESVAFQTVIGQTSNRPALVAASPIISNNQIVGVAMFASELPSIAEAVNANRIGESGQVYVIDAQDRPIAVIDPSVPKDKIDPLNKKNPVLALRAGTRGAYVYDDENGVRWHTHLDTLPNSWGVIVQQQESEFLSPLLGFQYIALAIFGLGAVILALLMWVTVGRALRPVQELADVATVAAGGDLNVKAQVKRYDEVGLLGQAFNLMIGRLRELIEALEQRVNARTEQLRASADVGRAAVSILDTNQLLREVVNLIAGRFGFYYAAVFLIDDTGKWAVLREATGEAGRTLKERGHRLEISSQSMVGAALRHRRPRIALDVGEEAIRFANPLLPETRSEIALPLIVGNHALGALDVQSKEEAAFDEASAAVLQSMADQIAIALSNTQQFQETQASLQHAHQQYDASLALVQAENATGVLSAFVTHVAPEAYIGLLVSYGPRETDGRQSYVVIEASWSLGVTEAKLTPGTRFTLDQLPFLKTISPAEPLLINDASEPIVDIELRRSMEMYHARSLVGLSLNAGVMPIGTLLIFYQEPRTYQAAELQAWQALAGQAAIVLHNQQLAREAQATLKQLDETNRRLIGQAWRDYARAGGGTVRKIDLSPGLPAEETLSPLPSTIAAPVMIHGQEVGSLRLEDTTPDRIWTASELALLQAVAREVSIALENARLIEQTERRAWRESIIGEVSGRMFAANDLETIIQIAAEELGHALRVSRAEIKIGSDTIAPALAEAQQPGGNGPSAKRQE